MASIPFYEAMGGAARDVSNNILQFMMQKQALMSSLQQQKLGLEHQRLSDTMGHEREMARYKDLQKFQERMFQKEETSKVHDWVRKKLETRYMQNLQNQFTREMQEADAKTQVTVEKMRQDWEKSFREWAEGTDERTRQKALDRFKAFSGALGGFTNRTVRDKYGNIYRPPISHQDIYKFMQEHGPDFGYFPNELNDILAMSPYLAMQPGMKGVGFANLGGEATDPNNWAEKVKRMFKAGRGYQPNPALGDMIYRAPMQGTAAAAGSQPATWGGAGHYWVPEIKKLYELISNEIF